MTDGFMIKNAATSGTPSLFLAAGRPDLSGPPIIQRPAEEGLSGRGYPGGFYGNGWADLRRAFMDNTGLAAWVAIYNGTSDTYALVKVQLYDPDTATWGVYSGVLHRFQIQANQKASTHPWVSFRAQITDLVNLSGSWG